MTALFLPNMRVPAASVMILSAQPPLTSLYTPQQTLAASHINALQWVCDMKPARIIDRRVGSPPGTPPYPTWVMP